MTNTNTIGNMKLLPFIFYVVVTGVHGFASPQFNALSKSSNYKLGYDSRYIPSNGGRMLLTAKKKDDVDSTSKPKDNSQLYGALAFFAVGCLFDFFVTHHGIGPWDPNYVL